MQIIAAEEVTQHATGKQIADQQTIHLPTQDDLPGAWCRVLKPLNQRQYIDQWIQAPAIATAPSRTVSSTVSQVIGETSWSKYPPAWFQSIGTTELSLPSAQVDGLVLSR
jgi:hypothetical protein